MSSRWIVGKNAYGEKGVLFKHACLDTMPVGTKIRFYPTYGLSAFTGRLMAGKRGVYISGKAVETFNIPQPTKGKIHPTFSVSKWEILKRKRNVRK